MKNVTKTNTESAAVRNKRLNIKQEDQKVVSSKVMNNQNKGELYNAMLSLMSPSIADIDMMNEANTAQGYESSYSTQKFLLSSIIRACTFISRGENKYGNVHQRYLKACDDRDKIMTGNNSVESGSEGGRLVPDIDRMTPFQIGVLLRFERYRNELEMITEIENQLCTLYRDITGEDFNKEERTNTRITDKMKEQLKSRLANMKVNK